MKFILFFICAVTGIDAHTQQGNKALTKRLFVKTNLTAVFAKKPSVSVEKLFSKTFSVEASFVQGRFDSVLFTDHYHYSGVLVRAKTFFSPIAANEVQPYVGGYTGLLKRTIQNSKGTTGVPYVTTADRDFVGKALRMGGTCGLQYISRTHIIVDGQSSLGYGVYYKQFDRLNPLRHSGGHLDVQIWLSVGYCF